MTRAIQAGDRVRLTARFLRATGQYVSREPFAVWTVLGFVGPWAIVNEPVVDAESQYTRAELDADPTLALRKVNVANLERVRT